LCVQLQGHLYFANITLFTDTIKSLLSETPGWFNYVILDFTLVLGVDSSASFALIKLVEQMKPSNLRYISFVTGKEDGFPCTVNLSELLLRKDGVAVNENLDLALWELEDLILEEEEAGLANELILDSSAISEILSSHGEKATLIYILSSHLPEVSSKAITSLANGFELRTCPTGTVLWRQSSAPTCLAVILEGELLSTLEEEAGTQEEVYPGDIEGEFSLALGSDATRLTTITSRTPCTYFVLSKDTFETLKVKRPELALQILQLTLHFVKHRLQHVSNRFIETRSIPV
jgi:hypothetical protein